MKFNIIPPISVEGSKPIVNVSLYVGTARELVLSAVDDKGDVISHLLEISENGQLCLCANISDELELTLDKEGYLEPQFT